MRKLFVLLGKRLAMIERKIRVTITKVKEVKLFVVNLGELLHIGSDDSNFSKSKNLIGNSQFNCFNFSIYWI